ncbi:hypothetical protein KBD81_01990 [Candidatus Woesebacteria bacterium]|nr:hypothetical protein [Candidatus Woesebacteria bacterium]
MAIVNIRDSNFLKLKSLRKENLKNFCQNYGLDFRPNITDTISIILDNFDNGKISTENINSFIRKLYIDVRGNNIKVTGATHQEIIRELNKVDEHIWGMVQGDVDSHIQSNYVRKFYKYDDVVSAIRANLYKSIESYALSSWFNHWSTVFLEDLINENVNVIPIIKKVKGVDIIWNEQPVDIKVTNLPKEWFKSGYNIDYAINNPKIVCKYMYELQGAQRFGDDNRLFVIIYDKNKPEESWKIKRDYDLIKSKINNFFDQKIDLDAINFKYGNKQYLAHSKVMFIVK